MVGCSPGPSPSQGCLRDTDCPTGTSCQKTELRGKPFGVCIKLVPKSGVNSPCKLDTDCVTTFCFQPNKESAYCTKNCTKKADCSAGMLCKLVGQGLQICVRDGVTPPPSQKGCQCGREGDSCSAFGHSDCDQAQGYFCLSKGPNDSSARCVKSCTLTSQPGQPSGCPENYICSATVNGINVCIKSPYPKGTMGNSCAKAGPAQCTDKLFCYSRFPSDPEAFCSRACSPYQENDCGEGFVCESPREQDPYLCIPRGKGELGADCSRRYFLDCKSGACISPTRRGNKFFCSKSCQPSKDKCPVGYKCEFLGHLYRYFCIKTSGGKLGALCNRFGNDECESKVCVLPKAGSINKICSQPCDEKSPCPGGWECDAKLKACVPKTGDKKIGEKCVKTEDCVNGTCVSDGAGKQFCSQLCSDSKQCPTNFECRALGFSQKYCLPKLAGNGKVGDPCPNGPGDCADGFCLTDIFKGRTFCTKRCNNANPPNPGGKCDAPYVCKQVGNRSYCTPKDYTAP